MSQGRQAAELGWRQLIPSTCGLNSGHCASLRDVRMWLRYEGRLHLRTISRSQQLHGSLQGRQQKQCKEKTPGLGITLPTA